MNNQEVVNQPRTEVFTLFTLFFPSLLIAVIPDIIGNFWWPIVFKGLLLFYQFVIIKRFLDAHYG